MTSKQTNTGVSVRATIESAGADDELLSLRRQVLTQLLELDNALSRRQWARAEACVQRYCDTIIDYVALSSYRMSDRITVGVHTRAAIASTTRDVLRFCDRYERGTGDIRQARPDLEHLALSLETRFELEDHTVPVTA